MGLRHLPATRSQACAARQDPCTLKVLAPSQFPGTSTRPPSATGWSPNPIPGVLREVVPKERFRGGAPRSLWGQAPGQFPEAGSQHTVKQLAAGRFPEVGPQARPGS